MRTLNGLLFFPRGGSAHVARALSTALSPHDWDVTLLAGSLPGGLGDAERFYADLDIVPVDLSDAPVILTYEDDRGGQERCVARVDDRTYEAEVARWAAALRDANAERADVLLLHHLTPMNEAAAQVAPGVPIVAHLHGTELALLEAIAERPAPGWDHAESWRRRMRRWAQACTAVVVQTPGNIDRASGLLGIDPGVCAVVPNGVDLEAFAPFPVDRERFWHEQLVDSPQGWRPDGDAGSVRYRPDDVAGLAGAVVLVAVSRYTAVKRLGALIRAFADAQRRTRRRAALVLVGGYPGEYGGEHPLDAVAASGARDVYLAGWHDHAELPEFFNAADAQVLASANEQFGLVLVEGMACGVPAIAIDRLGPAEIVDDGHSGWLVPPGDDAALADAIVAAVDDGEERARRGLIAHREAHERWGWPALAEQLAGVLDHAVRACGDQTTV